MFQTKTGIVGPLGMKSSVEARVHVRVANVGHHSETPKSKIGKIHLPFDLPLDKDGVEKPLLVLLTCRLGSAQVFTVFDKLASSNQSIPVNFNLLIKILSLFNNYLVIFNYGTSL